MGQTRGSAVTSVTFARRELQAQESLQSGQLCAGDGVPDLQPGALASQAMIEKILGEDPRWQGNPEATMEGEGGEVFSICKVTTWWTSPPSFVDHMGKLSLQRNISPPMPQVVVAEWDLSPGVQAPRLLWMFTLASSCRGQPVAAAWGGEYVAGTAPLGAPSQSWVDVHRTPALGTSVLPPWPCPAGLPGPSAQSLQLLDASLGGAGPALLAGFTSDGCGR